VLPQAWIQAPRRDLRAVAVDFTRWWVLVERADDNRLQDRLEILGETQLLGSEPEEAFDRLARLAQHVARAPFATIALVDDRREFWKSTAGLPGPWATRRELPLAQSLARAVIVARAPLVVEDARADARFADHPIVRELGVVAYAGVPLVVGGEAVGALAVSAPAPRAFSGEELQVLADVADAVAAKIELRRVARPRELGPYAALASHIPGAVMAIYDTDLRCLAIDGSLVRDLGRTPAALIGRPLREIAGFSEGDAAFGPAEAICRRTLAGESLTMDIAARGRTFALHTAPVRDGKGAISAGAVLALDVTRERALAAELRRNAQIYRAVVQHLPRGAVFIVDRDLRYISADGPLVPAIVDRFGRDTLAGMRVEEIVYPPNRDLIVDMFHRAFEGEGQRREVPRGDRFFETNMVPIYEGDVVTNVLAFSFDVTDRRREAEALREARDSVARERELLETMLANIEDGVALLDADRNLLLCNEPYAAMLGVSREATRGFRREDFLATIAPLLEDPDTFRADYDRLHSAYARGEYVFTHPRRRVLRRTWTPVRLGSGEGFLVTWHDVTAQRDLLREREEQALVDALTGVPNRRAAEGALRTEQERCKRAGTRLCVAMFDIDHFKRVNDEHGHAVGDDVLKAVASALDGEARMTDTVARWGGEEFVAVLSGPIEGARAFCERARAAVERLSVPPVSRLTISAGLAEVAPGEAVSDALGRADERLYEAKNAGRNRVVG
jgi:diguanylate cyclase (GGDEF)-like protein